MSVRARNRGRASGPCEDCGARDEPEYIKGLCKRCYHRKYMREYRGSNLNKRCVWKGICRDDALLIPGKLKLCRAHYIAFYGVDPAERDESHVRSLRRL